MYQQQVSTKQLLGRTLELTLAVRNVMESRHAGIVSDVEASLILTTLAKENKDLVLQEQEDPNVKELMRGVRVTLLPFADEPFHV